MSPKRCYTEDNRCRNRPGWKKLTKYHLQDKKKLEIVQKQAKMPKIAQNNAKKQTFKDRVHKP